MHRIFSRKLPVKRFLKSLIWFVCVCVINMIIVACILWGLVCSNVFAFDILIKAVPMYLLCWWKRGKEGMDQCVWIWFVTWNKRVYIRYVSHENDHRQCFWRSFYFIYLNLSKTIDKDFYHQMISFLWNI